MGLGYRKSIRIGKGIRVNISKSGIGYSIGVPGARVTKTASGKVRQTYSIPGTGISYVTESGSSKKSSSTQSNTSANMPRYEVKEEFINYENLSSDAYEEVVADVLKWRKYAGALIIVAVIFLGASAYSKLWLIVAIASFVAGIILSHTRGKLNVEYEFDEISRERYDTLCSVWKQAFESKGVFQISEIFKTDDVKNNLGTKLAADPIEIKYKLNQIIPADIKSNIKPLCIPLINKKGKKEGYVAILPDRVVISKGKIFKAIEHKHIETTVCIQPMPALSDACLKDARVVGEIYLHSNKDGSADMRYADNPSVPVVHYGRVDVKANGATLLCLLFSNISTIEQVENKIKIENLINSYNVN